MTVAIHPIAYETYVGCRMYAKGPEETTCVGVTRPKMTANFPGRVVTADHANRVRLAKYRKQPGMAIYGGVGAMRGVRESMTVDATQALSKL